MTATLKGGATPEAPTTFTVAASSELGTLVSWPFPSTPCRTKPNVIGTSWSFGNPPDAARTQRNWLFASGSAAPGQPAEIAALGMDASARSFGSGIRLVDERSEEHTSELQSHH